jgi:hypothetical protein
MQGYSFAFDTLPKPGRQRLELQQIHTDARAAGDGILDPCGVLPIHAASDGNDITALAKTAPGEATNEPSLAALRQQWRHKCLDVPERLRSMSFTLGAGPLRAFANQPCSCPGVYRHDRSIARAAHFDQPDAAAAAPL